MSWFNRNSDSKIKEQYLETTDTVSRPLATVFTIIIVFVLAAVAFSLFLGGRWLYRNLDGSNKPKVVVVENPITVTTPTAASTTNATNQTSGSSSASAAAPASSPTNVPAPTTNTPVTTTVQTIPATGPAETMIVFILAVSIATASHAIWQRSRI